MSPFFGLDRVQRVSKTLVIARHAKSAWPDGVADHERPLNDRGRRDAPRVGRWLRDEGLEPDLILVSSARRAVETLDCILVELGSAPRIEITDEIYGASTGDLLDLVRGLPGDVDAAMVLGHNPGVGMLASLIDDRGAGLMEFTTASLAAFDVGSHWSAVDVGSGRMRAAATPRG